MPTDRFQMLWTCIFLQTLETTAIKITVYMKDAFAALKETATHKQSH